MDDNPDDDTLVTAMDGTILDVTVDPENELVVLATSGRGVFQLSPSGARDIAEQLRVAADAMERGDIADA